jgi:hypothetical protein
MSHHFATREEELFKVGAISLERLATMSKVGLRMLPLSMLDSLLPEFSPFMLDVLEVVDFPAESPKCVHT